MKQENEELKESNKEILSQKKPLHEQKLYAGGSSLALLSQQHPFSKSFTSLLRINDAIHQREAEKRTIDLTVANPIHPEHELKSYNSRPGYRPAELWDYSLLTELQDALVNYAGSIFGTNKCTIHVGAGAMSIYCEIISALRYLRYGHDEHCEILLVAPIFGQLCTAAERNRFKTSFFEAKEENDWEIKTDDEIKELSERLRDNPNIKILVLNYPNNPTGKSLTKKGAENLVKAIRASGRKDITVISDETLGLTNLEEEYISFAKFVQSETDPIQCITIHSGSKIYNASHRIGFATIYPSDDELENHLPDSIYVPLDNEQIECADLINYFLGKKKADELKLNPESSKNECRKKIQYVKGKIKELNYNLNDYFKTNDIKYAELYIPNGNEYPDSGITINIKFNLKGYKVDGRELNDADDVAECLLCEKAGVAMVSGGTFCSEKLLNEMVLRMALFPNTKIIDEAFHRITEAIKEHCIPPQEKPKTDIEVKSFEKQASSSKGRSRGGSHSEENPDN